MKLTLTPEDRQRLEARLGRRLPPPDSQAFEDLLAELEATHPEIVTELRSAIRVIGVPSALQIQGSKAKEEARFAQLVKNLFYKKTADGFVQDKGKITRTALVSVAVLLSVGALGAVLKPADSSGLNLTAIAGGSGDPAKAPKVVQTSGANAKPVSGKDTPSSGKVDFPNADGSSAANGSATPAADSAGTSATDQNTADSTAPETVNYDVPSSQPEPSSAGYNSNGVRSREIVTRPSGSAVRSGTAVKSATAQTSGARSPRATNETTETPVRVVKTVPRVTIAMSAGVGRSTDPRSNKLQMGAGQNASSSAPVMRLSSGAQVVTATSSNAPSSTPSNPTPTPRPTSGMSVQNTPVTRSSVPASTPASVGTSLALQGAAPPSTAQIGSSGMKVQGSPPVRTSGFTSPVNTAPNTPVLNADAPGIALGGSVASKPVSTQAQSALPTDVNSGFPIAGSPSSAAPSAPGVARTGLPGSDALPPLESVLPVTVGMRLEARLVISVVAVEQGSAPIVAVTDNPPCGKETCPPLLWIGQALLGPDRRIWVSFTQATMDGRTYSVSGQALERTELRPGLPAAISDEAPALVSDLLRGAIGTFSDYLGASLGQRTTTVIPGGGAQSSATVPALTNFFLGRLSNLFSIPSDSKALVRVARVPIDTTLTVLYGIPLNLGR